MSDAEAKDTLGQVEPGRVEDLQVAASTFKNRLGDETSKNGPSRVVEGRQKGNLQAWETRTQSHSPRKIGMLPRPPAQAAIDVDEDL